MGNHLQQAMRILCKNAETGASSLQEQDMLKTHKNIPIESTNNYFMNIWKSVTEMNKTHNAGRI